MPPSRFGASKFRNAQPYISGKEEWYRTNLPSSSSSTTSSSTSTFSSEIKANREWIVTLTPIGELSYRGYDVTGKEGVGVLKVGSGGGVGDWDLSRLEGGTLAIGGLDGSISVYSLPSPGPSPAAPSLRHTIPSSGSAITSLSLHPTTPDLLLASTVSLPVAIYDLSLSSTAPALQLSTKEPKGMWSVGWSPDGRLVAGVGKSGTCYIWDPRAGGDAIMSKTLNLQALKPVRLAWVGDDIFLTSFSKTRNREYSLLSTSSSLSTTFSQSVDTNTAPLIPLVDQERRIVYLAGRGDMTLRQVELSGPMGFQETLHPLPHPLASAGLALASPTTLPVMNAQIATLLVPVVDKDGDAILPLGIRVPRRQLLDFHEDLYPDVLGTVSEQTTEEWLKGEDRLPLPISLDPSRRGAWEADLARRIQAAAETSPAPKTLSTTTATPSAVSTLAPDSKPSAEPVLPVSASTPVPDSTATAPISEPQPSTTSAPAMPSAEPESTSSTSYKARIITEHIVEQLEIHRTQGKNGPLMVGLQGPQGCGKTTLCDGLLSYLAAAPRSLKVAVLSLDDLYRTNAGLKEIARKHPNNQLLSGRGPPGTHDVALAASVLEAVKSINDAPDRVVHLPIFDKSLCNGEGDRSEKTVDVQGPLDVFILEGWSMGFAPLSGDDLTARFASGKNAEKDPYFTAHSLTSLSELNDYLDEFANTVYPHFETIVAIEPTDYENVFRWRLEQEQAMKAKNGGKGMADEQVRAFVERYMPGYELWWEGIWGDARPWTGRGLKLVYGPGREVLALEKPRGAMSPPSGSSTTAPASTTIVPATTTMTPSTTTAPAAGMEKTPVPTKPAQEPAASVNPTSAPSQPASTAAPATKPTPPSSVAPFNPSWSRKFLGAKAPLIPSYDSLPPLATLRPDSLILKATPHVAFFPIQGTGGRLCVHPLAKKGRMKLGGEGYLSSGVEIVDFAVELFDAGRVAVAGEDGAIRVWKVGQAGVEGVGPEAEQVLKGKGIDKIAQVEFHPTARDLLVVGSNDSGVSAIRFFDLATGDERKVCQVEAKGIFNFSWSSKGDRLAISTKDGHVLVLDPRDPSSAISGPAHDSPRSFQLEWIDDAHLISVGFSRGSQRKINLYNIGTEVKTISSLLVDISPSVLFARYDPNTCILYVWGKGERVIQAYEVHPDANEPIAKLPSYTAGEAQVGVCWLPKRTVDVKKVEVAKVLRLTGKTMEEVSFSIPRNKPEFFQDDIYVDTLDIETPVTSAADWLAGANPAPARRSLKPDGITPLSQAPKTTSAAKAKFVPAKDVMSEEEKKKREMDALFAKAKADESSDDEPQRGGLDPPDDDW